MPLPRTLARLNRVGLNRITRPLAQWLPGLGVLIHTGRTSGTIYRTPVNVFRGADGGYAIALTYGPTTDWLRNVRAAGGCELVTRRRRVRLTTPEVVHDPSRTRVSPLARPILRLLNVADFLVLHPAD